MLRRDERGAVAIEFALILPVLVLLLVGIVELGRAYNAQISLTNAAREGARVMAITSDPAAARTAARNAAVTVSPPLTDAAVTVAACAPGAQTTVTINYRLPTVTGFTGPFSMTGRGVMLCEG